MSANFAALAKNALVEELEQLHREVQDIITGLGERALWVRPVIPGNSVGHLALHLTGNLNHFVGRHLGHTDYTRDREREFTETNAPPKDVLLQNLADAVAQYRRVVTGLSEEQLAATHPEAKFGSVFKALTHFVAHFGLHRGQMSYLARLAKG